MDPGFRRGDGEARMVRRSRRSESDRNTHRPHPSRPEDLADAGLVPAERVPALEAVAARYAVAITPAMAELIDPTDPHDPIARQFVPDPAELETRPEESADPIGDDVHAVRSGPDPPLSRPGAPQACAGLRRLLPLLLPPRDGGTRRRAPAAGGARRGAGLHRRPSRGLGGHRLGRRPAGRLAAPHSRR